MRKRDSLSILLAGLLFGGVTQGAAPANATWSSTTQEATTACATACPQSFRDLAPADGGSTAARLACQEQPQTVPGSFDDERLIAPSDAVGINLFSYEGEWQTVVCAIDPGANWRLVQWADVYEQCITPPMLVRISPPRCTREVFARVTPGDVLVIRSFNGWDLTDPMRQEVSWRWCTIPCDGPVNRT